MWTDKAACKGKGEIFYAPPSERPQARLRREAIAIAICLSCPVIAECREEGRDEEYGIWGGTTEIDRGLRVDLRKRK